MAHSLNGLLAMTAIFIFFSEGLKEYAEGAFSSVKRIIAEGVSRWIEVVFLAALVISLFGHYMWVI